MILGLIAGNGRFPFLLLDAARAEGGWPGSRFWNLGKHDANVQDHAVRDLVESCCAASPLPIFGLRREPTAEAC
ncbi:MAG: hypothetical protein ACLGSH_17970 [Acidobacteriota bacterium]